MLEFKKIADTVWEDSEHCLRIERLEPWQVCLSRHGVSVRHGTVVTVPDTDGELVLLNFLRGYATIPEGIELPDSFVVTPQVSGVIFA